jgi:hypothetical protein
VISFALRIGRTARDACPCVREILGDERCRVPVIIRIDTRVYHARKCRAVIIVSTHFILPSAKVADAAKTYRHADLFLPLPFNWMWSALC